MPRRRERGRPPDPRPGKNLKNHPSGFPLFFDQRKPRVVTADPWAFLRHLVTEELRRPEASRSLSYIDQAFDFFQAAENPRIGSKPLLYYYSFLNLAKVALLLNGVAIPLRVWHGIEDPAANIRERLRFSGQQIKIRATTSNRDQLFSELWKVLGGDVSRARLMRLMDVLAQVPSIHRTFTRVTGGRTALLPIKRMELRQDNASIWVRLVVARHDRDVETTLPRVGRRQAFTLLFRRVHSNDASEDWFESRPVRGRGRATDTAIAQLAASLGELPLSTILTGDGYRLYVSDVSPGAYLHPLAAQYAVMFYLGSVTRYKPDVFDKIIDGAHAWIVEEFLASAPVQFIYILASVLAGVDVVRPYAAVWL